MIRRLVRAVIFGLLLPAIAAAGLITQSGSRLFTSSGGGSGDPLDLPLATESNLSATYLGSFNVPQVFEYGGGAMSIGGSNDLYVTGLDTANTLGRINIPSIGGTATTATSPVSVSASVAGQCSGQDMEQKLTGSLYKGGTLLVVKSTSYDTCNAMNKWILTASATVGSQGTFSGMSAARGSTPRMAAGPLIHIPTEWQGILGGDVGSLGARGLNIVSTSQSGYGFAVFNFADVVSGGTTVAVDDLLGYEFSNRLEPVPSDPSYASYPKNSAGGVDYFSQIDGALGTAFIPSGSRSLLFVVAHAYGPGGPAGGPCRPGGSVRNEPYREQFIAYDLRDLAAVKAGTKNRYSVQPTGWWELPGWDSIWDGCVGDYPGSGTAAYDPVTRKLYIQANGFHGSDLEIHVWQIGTVP